MLNNFNKKSYYEKLYPKYVCYTLDLEEDHAGLLKNHNKGLYYLEDFIQKIKERSINISIFLQSKLIEKFPEKLEIIRQNNIDIHLHSYSHSLRKIKNIENATKEIEKSLDIYQNFFGNHPKGYRFPLGIINEKEYKILKELNFKFDSSIFPTIRPGFFNNLNKPLRPYIVQGIVEIPFSVFSNLIRIPISLSFIKLLFPLHFIRNYFITPLIFDFHIHDLYNLSSTNNLNFINRIPYFRFPNKGLDLFLRFHDKLVQEKYHTVKIIDIYKKIIEEHKSGGSSIKTFP